MESDECVGMAKKKQKAIVGDKYRGKYVAVESLVSNKVVAAGKSPSVVYQLAIKRGYDEPVMFFVPKKNIACIY